MKKKNKKGETIIDNLFRLDGIAESDDGGLELKHTEILYSSDEDYKMGNAVKGSGLYELNKLMKELRDSIDKMNEDNEGVD